MTTTTLDHDQRLAAVPELYRRLMAQPLKALTRARLPASGAVYVFYQEDEPIHVGSPPHLEEQMLAPSLRLALAARVHKPSHGAARISVSEPPPAVRTAGTTSRDSRARSSAVSQAASETRSSSRRSTTPASARQGRPPQRNSHRQAARPPDR